MSSDNNHPPSFDPDTLVNECRKMMTQYWQKNPDLHKIVEEKKDTARIIAKLWEGFREQPAPLLFPTPVAPPSEKAKPSLTERTLSALDRLGQLKQSPMLQWHWVSELKNKIQEGQKIIHETIADNHGEIAHRTNAHNRKCTFQSIEEERDFRANLLKDQVLIWKKLLPSLLKKFARIPDPRKPGSITHKKTVLLLYGLLAFVFKLSSCREMNRELSSTVAFEQLKAIFPDIETLPHACTLTRFLEKTNPQDIEEANIYLIRDLILNKKLKNLLIHGCLPVTIDGAQKLYRNGVLQDPRWCERLVGNEENKRKQQYVYVVEANLTFKNGLSIPLMSEFLYRNSNQLNDSDGKQDSETTAFKRLALRLKKYFPRLKLLIFGDAMFATTGIMELLRENHWEFIIRFSKRQLTSLAKTLNSAKKNSFQIPGQPMYRERWQTFYWKNNLHDGFGGDLKIHLVGCTEHYQEVDKLTGKIEERYVERAWISSILITSDKLHELINLGARKKELIEDNINTMKNRGYCYKHAFAYDFNAMQGFHYLMRLGLSLNSIAEFSKMLKKYVKSLGCSATLKFIKETLFNPWLPLSWYEDQRKKKSQLCLQME